MPSVHGIYRKDTIVAFDGCENIIQKSETSVTVERKGWCNCDSCC